MMIPYPIARSIRRNHDISPRASLLPNPKLRTELAINPDTQQTIAIPIVSSWVW